MKFRLLLLFFLGGITVKAQNEFAFTDTTFRNGESMTTNRIFFELNKDQLRFESTAFLDSMVIFLNQHPNLQLEIQNHTDSRAKKSYSTNLTQRRAQTIMDYLVQKGIEKKRLIAKGYFNTQLLITDEEINQLKTKSEKEEAHQKNRRTVFVVVGI